MGVSRLFSRGAEGKISRGPGAGGGAKTYYLPKKHPKRYYFSRKSQKHTILPGQGRQEPPLALL